MHRLWWQWNAAGVGGPLPHLHRLSGDRSDQFSGAIGTVESPANQHPRSGQTQLSDPSPGLILSRQASARSAYPCQTLLLGVQADLVMQQLQAGRGAQAIADLQAATRGCAGL